jgi:hypothetical protein
MARLASACSELLAGQRIWSSGLVWLYYSRRIFRMKWSLAGGMIRRNVRHGKRRQLLETAIVLRLICGWSLRHGCPILRVFRHCLCLRLERYWTTAGSLNSVLRVTPCGEWFDGLSTAAVSRWWVGIRSSSLNDVRQGHY